MRWTALIVLAHFALSAPAISADAPGVDFNTQIRPIFVQRCVGCHNAKTSESDVRLDDPHLFPKQVDDKPFIVAGDPSNSGIMQMILGKLQPQMPPEDEPPLSESQIALLKQWIDQGASFPKTPDAMNVSFPTTQPADGSQTRINAIDWSSDQRTLALARFQRVDLFKPENQQPIATIDGLPGKVQCVRFTPDGKQVLSASGIVGARGHVAIWNVADGKLVRQWNTPGDAINAVDISPDGKLVAAGGYERTIRIWQRDSGRLVNELTGHNGAIYSLRFDPSSTVLASASGDETIKLWNVTSGLRLDTLGQPLAEQYCVEFTPDGSQVIGAGADNRLRCWKLASKTKQRISPLVVARFAHQRPIVAISISPDGRLLCSAAEDGTLKLWARDEYRLVHQFPSLSEPASGLEFIDNQVLVTTLSGQMHRLDVPGGVLSLPNDSPASDWTAPITGTIPEGNQELASQQEVEPNDNVKEAQATPWPSVTTGVVSLAENDYGESDLFAIDARQGQAIKIEVTADGKQSPLDAHVQILDAQGDPIPRVKLQAVRDSYFTFRGKDSRQVNDFRMHNWQEMELNQYLYSSGEVVRLWLYPRGPDSGFTVYPGLGKRTTYFGTTPTTHALGEPAFIVRPLPPDSNPLPNGLPVFTIYYENDDDPLQRDGSNARLQFVAPSDGRYLVRVRDARNFGGPDYRYRLTIRHPQPDFSVSITAKDLKVHRGTGAEFTVQAKRDDGFDGPIHIETQNVPDGMVVTTPLIIEAGQISATGTIYAAPDAAPPTDDAPPIELVAVAQVGNEQVRKPIGALGKVEIDDADSVLLTLDIQELTIHPGETVSANISVDRGKFKGHVEFGKEDSGRNFPHGVFIDNIGLNGLMIPDGQSQREFFITAAPWVPPSDRWVHLRATTSGKPTCRPILLKVRPQD